jgi:quinol monooxygenase YgiN
MITTELTRFRVSADRRDALLAARPQMLRDFAADRAGFLGAALVELPDGEWLDIVRWRSAADFATSRAKGANLPGIAAFFAAIDELVAAEEGTEIEFPGAEQGGHGS